MCEALSDAILQRVYRTGRQSWSLWLENDSASPRSRQEPGLTTPGLSHEAQDGALAFGTARTICVARRPPCALLCWKHGSSR